VGAGENEEILRVPERGKAAKKIRSNHLQHDDLAKGDSRGVSGGNREGNDDEERNIIREDGRECSRTQDQTEGQRSRGANPANSDDDASLQSTRIPQKLDRDKECKERDHQRNVREVRKTPEIDSPRHHKNSRSQQQGKKE